MGKMGFGIKKPSEENSVTLNETGTKGSSKKKISRLK